MLIKAIKDKYRKLKDTSDLTGPQLDNRVKWAKRGALVAAVFCVGAVGIGVAGISAAAVVAGTTTAKLGLSASFMAASSAVKSFISNRICTALQKHYEKEQVKRGEKPAPPVSGEKGTSAKFGKRGFLGNAFRNGLKTVRGALRAPPPKSGFAAPKA